MATPNPAMGSLYIVRDTMTAVQEPKAGEPIKAGAAIQVKGRGRSVYSSFDCVDHFGAGFDYVVPRDPIDIVALCGARRYQVGGGAGRAATESGPTVLALDEDLGSDAFTGRIEWNIRLVVGNPNLRRVRQSRSS